jgi:hypothetical protein
MPSVVPWVLPVHRVSAVFQADALWMLSRFSFLGKKVQCRSSSSAFDWVYFTSFGKGVGFSEPLILFSCA